MTRWLLAFMAMTAGSVLAAPLEAPAPDEYTQADAARMERHLTGPLAPVYPALAEHLAAHLDLADRHGIGIDLGSGPGTLVLELAKRTPLHWVNADINPNCFPFFMAQAGKAGLTGRVSAVFADAQWLPFRDNYADVLVSRGSFQFWGDLEKAFAEVLRVLRPGATAYIGRGFSPNLPPEVAGEVRRKQKEGGRKGPPPYDLDETEALFKRLMAKLGVEDYQIHRPQPPGSAGILYGIWLEFRKPEGE